MAATCPFWTTGSGVIEYCVAPPPRIVGVSINSPANAGAIISDDGGDTWHAGYVPVDPSLGWTPAAWNGSILCMLGGEKSAISSDGLDWVVTATAPNFFTYNTPVWGGDRFCVTTTSRAAMSLDGANWSVVSLASGSYSQLAWNGSVFCATAQNPYNKAITSTDGVTWVLRTLPVSGHWHAPVWNGSVFCVIEKSAYSGPNKCITSPDGISWSSGTMPSGYWSIPVWNGTKFCAINSITGNSCTSENGLTWVLGGNAITGGVGGSQSLVWTGEYWCAMNGISSAVSDDGITWNKVTLSGIGLTYSMIYVDNMFIASVSSGVVAYRSFDGLEWAAITLPSSGIWRFTALT